MTSLRIGHGYDVHRLTEGRKLIMGGVEIPYTKGLLGHSDADVLIHAVMDALLGAAHLPDIGQLFPDNDPAFEGISSRILLRKVADKLKEEAWEIVNIDATILAQRPKMRPHEHFMEINMSADLGVSSDRVHVKATTEEGLGFTGSGEGIAVHAVALIEKL